MTVFLVNPPAADVAFILELLLVLALFAFVGVLVLGAIVRWAGRQWRGEPRPSARDRGR